MTTVRAKTNMLKKQVFVFKNLTTLKPRLRRLMHIDVLYLMKDSWAANVAGVLTNNFFETKVLLVQYRLQHGGLKSSQLQGLFFFPLTEIPCSFSRINQVLHSLGILAICSCQPWGAGCFMVLP